MNLKLFHILLLAFTILSCQSSQELKEAKYTIRSIPLQPDDPVYRDPVYKDAAIRMIDKDSLTKEDSVFIKRNPGAWLPSHIDFTVEKDDSVFVDMYDIKGKLSDHLFSSFLKRGNYLITPIKSSSTGVYFIKFKIGSASFTKKYIITK